MSQNLFKAFKNAHKSPVQSSSVLPLELNEKSSITKQLLDPQSQPISLSLIPIPQVQKKYDYDPDKYPPDIKMAQDHALARRVSIPSYLLDQLLTKDQKSLQNDPIDLCDCCGCPLKNQQLPLCSSRYELFFLGSGFPLFFDFMIWGICLLMLIFLISSIFGLASNSEDREEIFLNDTRTWFVKLSLANNFDPKDPDFDINDSVWKKCQMIVNFFTILISLVFLQFFRRSLRKTAFECDFKSLTPSDFTLKISGLPLNFLDYELKEHFKKIGGELLPVKVVKINKTYAIGSYVKLVTEKNKCLAEKRDFEEEINAKNKREKTPKIQKEIEILSKKIQEKSELLYKLEANVKEERSTLVNSYIKFTGTAYVTFETPEQSQFVKKSLKKTFKQRMNILFNKGLLFDSKHFYQGKTLLYAERAPEPNDIIWENLGIDWIEKFKLQWWTAFYTFLVLLSCFFCIFGLTFLQKYLLDPADLKISNKKLGSFINALGAILISVINYLLNFVIKKFASLEKHLTITGYVSSIASKKIFAQFLNTAIIYIIISWLKSSWIEQTGLIDQLLNICISTILVNSLLFAFDPMYLLKVYQRRNLVKNAAKSMMTQSEAHTLFEDPTLDIPNLYSGVINVMLFSAFYATLQPLVVLFGIFTLCVFYWIFKLILIRRSSIPVELGKRIAYDMIELAEYIPLMYSLGDVLFNVIFYHYPNPWSITACCLCFVNFIVPMNLVNKKLFSLEEKHKMINESADYRRNFETARIHFTFEYDRLNPITQQKAVEEWVNFIEKKKGNTSEVIMRKSDEKQKDLKKNSVEEKKNEVLVMEIEEKQKENDEEELGIESYLGIGKEKEKENPIERMQGQQKPMNLLLAGLKFKK